MFPQQNRAALRKPWGTGVGPYLPVVFTGVGGVPQADAGTSTWDSPGRWGRHR